MTRHVPLSNHQRSVRLLFVCVCGTAGITSLCARVAGRAPVAGPGPSRRLASAGASVGASAAAGPAGRGGLAPPGGPPLPLSPVHRGTVTRLRGGQASRAGRGRHAPKKSGKLNQSYRSFFSPSWSRSAVAQALNDACIVMYLMFNKKIPSPPATPTLPIPSSPLRPRWFPRWSAAWRGGMQGPVCCGCTGQGSAHPPSPQVNVGTAPRWSDHEPANEITSCPRPAPVGDSCCLHRPAASCGPA